jgi:hypothetical protein
VGVLHLLRGLELLLIQLLGLLAELGFEKNAVGLLLLFDYGFELIVSGLLVLDLIGHEFLMGPC